MIIVFDKSHNMRMLVGKLNPNHSSFADDRFSIYRMHSIFPMTSFRWLQMWKSRGNLVLFQAASFENGQHLERLGCWTPISLFFWIPQWKKDISIPSNHRHIADGWKWRVLRNKQLPDPGESNSDDPSWYRRPLALHHSRLPGPSEAGSFLQAPEYLFFSFTGSPSLRCFVSDKNWKADPTKGEWIGWHGRCSCIRLCWWIILWFDRVYRIIEQLRQDRSIDLISLPTKKNL